MLRPAKDYSYAQCAWPYPTLALGQHAAAAVAAAALQQCKTVRHVWCRNPSTEIDLRHSQPGQLRLLAIFGHWLASRCLYHSHSFSPSPSLSVGCGNLFANIFQHQKYVCPTCLPPSQTDFACRCNCAADVSFYSSSSSFFLCPTTLFIFWLFPFLPGLKFGFSPGYQIILRIRHVAGIFIKFKIRLRTTSATGTMNKQLQQQHSSVCWGSRGSVVRSLPPASLTWLRFGSCCPATQLRHHWLISLLIFQIH